MNKHRNKKVIDFYPVADLLVFLLEDDTMLTFSKSTNSFPDIVCGGSGWDLQK